MLTSRRAALKALLASASATRLKALAGDSIHRDTVHLDVEHQVIENFGASDCWSMQRIGTWQSENRNRVADLLFSPTRGIALSCWRFNIGGGVNSRISDPWRAAETFEIGKQEYDWNRQAPERWFLSAAKSRSVPQFLAFVNSPPGRLTRNGVTFCDPEGYTTNLKIGFEEQYARYLVDILEHFRTNPEEQQRVAFDYISPVNEPQWDWAGHSQEGNRASNADIKRIVRALAAELDRRKCPTQLAIVESGSLPDMWQLDAKATGRWGAPYGDYLDAFLGDASFSPLLFHRIGYHSYGSDRINGPLLEDRRKLAEAMKKYPGWKLWQTEYCLMVGSEGQGGEGRDLTMNTALDVARIIHLDLTVAGVSAWQWWTAVSPVDYKDGLIFTDWKKPGDPETIYPARLLWALGNYSRFVRPGMMRVELTGANHDIGGLMGGAFKDQRGSSAVVVYVNIARSAQAVELNFGRGWKARSITPYVTSDRSGDELKPYPAVGGAETITIPARSVVTLAAEVVPV